MLKKKILGKTHVAVLIMYYTQTVVYVRLNTHRRCDLEVRLLVFEASMIRHFRCEVWS